MRRTVPLCLLCWLVIAAPGSGAPAIPLEVSIGESPTVAVQSADENGLSLVFELSELLEENVVAADHDFQLVSIPGGDFTGAVGEPAVPVFTRLIAIPDQAEIEVRVIPLEVEERTGYNLLPIQPDDAEDVAFAYDASAYARNSLDVGEEPVSIGEPAVLRDMRVVPLTFRPVQYDAARQTMTVTRRMRVEIDFVGGVLDDITRTHRRVIPTSFDQLYRHLVVNYTGPRADQVVLPGTNLIICYNHANVISNLQPLVEWHTRKGVPTILATTAETGTSRTSIKAYIQGVYNDPSIALEYVTLVGDASGTNSIPCWYESLSGYGGEGDHPYTQLEGNDILADVHIGRLSFYGTDYTMLARIVNKVVGYESSPYLSDPGWFTRGCVVGDPGNSGESVVICSQWAKTRMMEVGYTEVDTVFTGYIESQMRTALNRGDTIFTYRGWLGMSGWSNGDTNALTNGWKMPYAVILTCSTGSFASGTSRSEGFLRAGTGVDQPRGAIGSIGTATSGTHTRYNNCIYYGILRGLLQEGQRSMGSSLTRGKLEMYLNYNETEPNKVEIWSYWNNLMGDPVVDIYTGYPEPLEVAHPTSLAIGANSVQIVVTDGSGPAAGVLVCLWKGDETYAVGYADAAGAIELAVDAATAGDMLLTVTRHNNHAYLASIPVVVADVYVGFETMAIDDDTAGSSSGNGDGQVNPGETIELGAQLRNFGILQAPNVTAKLSNSDGYVTVLDDLEEYGTIGGGGIAWSADDFDFSVSGACPHGHVLRFGLEVSSDFDLWHSLIEIPVVSAAFEAQHSTLYNHGGNNRLDPGETVDLSVEILNDGGIAATNVTGTLVSLSPFVTVGDDAGSFGTIGVGGSGENTGDRFTVTASPATYQGYLASFLLVTQFSGGISHTAHLELVIGSRSTDDPIGPDGHGYLAFDDTDTSYPEVPTYSWVELDPIYGGDGIEVVLGDNGGYNDKVRTVDLPFTFTYYGQDFNTASVCSNGWLAMGSTYLRSYRNWTIPGAGGPAGMIAPFWDNLYQTGSAKAYQKYDAAGGRWILEWSRFRNDYNGSTETFQVILYDPAVHPTETGDGLILFQYEAVSNYDPTNGYATVGIESPDMLDGLLYSYWNRYPDGAAILAAGRAIRFVPTDLGQTTSVGDAVGAVPLRYGLVQNVPNPFNPVTTIRYSLAAESAVRLEIFNVLGQQVTTLVGGQQAAGAQSATWEATGFASGIYFYKLTAGEYTATRKMVLIE